MRSPDHMAHLALLRSGQSDACMPLLRLAHPSKDREDKGSEGAHLYLSDVFFILPTLSLLLQLVYCSQGGVSIALGSWIANPYVKKCPLIIVAPEALGTDVLPCIVFSDCTCVGEPLAA